jgi:hypothetical protein
MGTRRSRAARGKPSADHARGCVLAGSAAICVARWAPIMADLSLEPMFEGGVQGAVREPVGIACGMVRQHVRVRVLHDSHSRLNLTTTCNWGWHSNQCPKLSPIGMLGVSERSLPVGTQQHLPVHLKRARCSISPTAQPRTIRASSTHGCYLSKSQQVRRGH